MISSSNEGSCCRTRDSAARCFFESPVPAYAVEDIPDSDSGREVPVPCTLWACDFWLAGIAVAELRNGVSSSGPSSRSVPCKLICGEWASRSAGCRSGDSDGHGFDVVPVAEAAIVYDPARGFPHVVVELAYDGPDCVDR